MFGLSHQERARTAATHALLDAVSRQDTAQIETLLDQGVNPNQVLAFDVATQIEHYHNRCAWVWQNAVPTGEEIRSSIVVYLTALTTVLYLSQDRVPHAQELANMAALIRKGATVTHHGKPHHDEEESLMVHFCERFATATDDDFQQPAFAQLLHLMDQAQAPWTQPYGNRVTGEPHSVFGLFAARWPRTLVNQLAGGADWLARHAPAATASSPMLMPGQPLPYAS
jgi:hypothetical protein